MSKYRGKLVGRLLAELAVVIIGVLIALEFEDRRQSSASVRVETAQLVALRADLVENRVRLDSVRVRQDRSVSAGRLLVALHAGQAERPSDLILAIQLNRAMSWWRFEPVTGAYDAMVSSGDITRLQNQDLIGALASFSGDVQLEFEDHDQSMALWVELRRIQAQHGLDALDPGLLRDLDISLRPSGAALSSMVADPLVGAFVAIRTRLEMNRVELYQRLAVGITDLLNTVEAELAERGASQDQP